MKSELQHKRLLEDTINILSKYQKFHIYFEKELEPLQARWAELHEKH